MTDPSAARQPTGADTLAMVRFELSWQSDHAAHCDCWVEPDLDLSRTDLPASLAADLLDQSLDHCRSRMGGRCEVQRRDVTDWVPAYREDRLLELDPAQFNRRMLAGRLIHPRVGRFYPKGILTGVEGIAATDRSPMRVAALDASRLRAELNHPLAGKALTLGARIEAITDRDPHAGHSALAGARTNAPTEAPANTLAARITADGPGMQARWRDQPTDFFSDRAFDRQDPRPDAGFYAKARLVHHLDQSARAELSALFGRLLPPGARILDLMTSWDSHLPDSLQPAAVTGLGLNAAELAANAALDARVVHDLNRDPTLPFDDSAFDAALCTVSVEYLVKPLEVFRELARVLRPGGLFVVTVSDRWFPPKAVRVWREIHPFERAGLVLEYFLRSGRFADLNTWSLRGLPRPADDKYAGRVALSDPLHALWGRRSGADGS
ncbi:methyltransferase domain-containing protein [Thiohalocapsa marina]|uniref:methyltransferase domain-containing protein n=1 Tax=Thiohalocapsa marina TaxID=424902 RepID=UPI0036DA73EF